MNIRTTLVIRYAMVLLFLWFGMQQLLHATDWVGYLPEWTGYLPIPSIMFVRLNGWFEVLFAILLAFGFYTRLAAALLGLHLLGIALSVGGAVGVRDAALAATTIALSFSSPDSKTLDQYLAKKIQSAPSTN